MGTRIFAIPLALIALSTAVTSAGAQVPDTSAIAGLIAAQVRSEHALFSLPNRDDFDAHQVAVTNVSLGTPAGVVVYRGVAWTLEHWHPYLVALVDGHMLPLGGFPGPELTQAASSLNGVALNKLAVRGLARVLAALADPNGARNLVFAGDPDTSASGRAAMRRWSSATPKSWPADTMIVERAGQETVVQLTVLSEAYHILGRPWQPIAYSFAFDTSGRLVAWAKREGEFIR